MNEGDCSEFLDSLIENMTERAKDNCKYLLDRVQSTLPHMEPMLRQVYLETLIVTLLGFSNVSLILQGVLLEALVKEIIFEKEKAPFQRPFGPAIQHCIDNEYIEQLEFEYLTEFKDKIRNPYQHIDIEKITGGSSVLAWKIPIDKTDVAGSMLKGIQAFHDGLAAGPPERLTVNELRAVGAIIKNQIDEENYLIQYLQTEWFVRMMAQKHFPTE